MSQHDLGHGPDREARIESIRRQIAAGTYRVSSSTLAHALMQHMHQKQMRRAA